MRLSIPKSLTFDTLSYFIPSLLRIPRNTSAFPLKNPTNALNKLPITAFLWLETVRFSAWDDAFHILKPCVPYTETLRLIGWHAVYHRSDTLCIIGLKHWVSKPETLCLKTWNATSHTQRQHYIGWKSSVFNMIVPTYIKVLYIGTHHISSG